MGATRSACYDPHAVRVRPFLAVMALVACFSESSEVDSAGDTTTGGADETSGARTGSGTDSGADTTTGTTASESDTAQLDTSTSDTATTDSTGMPVAGCGNGETEGDEECDDANDDPTDGCHLCRASGSVLWEAWNATSSNRDGVAAIAVDSQDNIYAAGLVGAGGGTDLWLRKFAPNGDTDWTRTPHPSVEPVGDLFFDVVIGPNDTILAAGQVFEPGQAFNFIVVTYDANGDLVDELFEDSSATGGIDGATSVAINGSGTLVSSGYRSESGPDTVAVVRLHDGSATEPRYEDGFGPGQTFATGWKLQLEGGNLRTALLLGNQVEIVGWNAGFGDGSPTWTQPIAGPLAYSLSVDVLEPVPVVIEGDGTTVVCTNVDTGAGRDAQLTRIDVGGSVSSNELVDVDGADDLCGGIAVLGNGDLAIVTSADYSGNDGDFIVTRRSPAGETRWQVALPPVAAGRPRAFAVAVDSEGLLLVGGSRNQRPGDADAYIAKLVP